MKDEYIKIIENNPMTEEVWLTNATGLDATTMITKAQITSNGKRILFKGNPKPTSCYSVEQLRDMGMVGVYELK